MLPSFSSLAPYWVLIFVVSLFFVKKNAQFSRTILWASLRTTIQLIALAFGLELIFKSEKFTLTLIVGFVMTLNSSLQLSFRSEGSRLYLLWITLFSQVLALWPLAFYFSFDESMGTSWLTPESLLPLLGMLLGNTLNGVSIARSSFMQVLNEKKNEVYSLLAMGATQEEATRKIFIRSLQAGITPQLNSMMAMGLVSIPGMMAGQLISKTSALGAALTQIKMMLSILAGGIICISIMLRMLRFKLFGKNGELCL
jgi:putative ABC transport system permease protein